MSEHRLLLHTQVQRQQYHVKCSKLFKEISVHVLHSSGILCSSDSQLQTHWQHLSVLSARVQQSKKTYAQSNFYASLWSLNGLKDSDRNISTLKMIQRTGNCSLLKIQKVMKVHVLVARLQMTLN